MVKARQKAGGNKHGGKVARAEHLVPVLLVPPKRAPMPGPRPDDGGPARGERALGLWEALLAHARLERLEGLGAERDEAIERLLGEEEELEVGEEGARRGDGLLVGAQGEPKPDEDEGRVPP